MVEQAVKTKQLVTLYYGKAPKYGYYDGHSRAAGGATRLFRIILSSTTDT